MSSQLKVAIGQYSDKGRKGINQDFHGALVPPEPLLGSKGIVIALADGISTSTVAHLASESAIKSLIEDYYCTSEAWSVKTSASRVLAAANSWLYAQTRHSDFRYDQERGYVCTLSALILKATTAYLFHVGDSRIYRLRGRSLEQLTHDHRVATGENQHYLSRALGAAPEVDIDYRSLRVEQGDVFVLATDGVYEHVSHGTLVELLTREAGDPDRMAQAIAEEAYQRGSTDNLTIQVLRVEALPSAKSADPVQELAGLAPAPLLEPRSVFEGYRILRQLHGSSRSHIYLAEDEQNGQRVALKIPSVDLRGDPAYLERFMLEEWIARRVDSAHVLKAYPHKRQRNYLYVVSEFIDGKTLAQWMLDNPKPDLETVRNIVEQIAKGLQAFHRMEMLHQDLRPHNVMIDASGTVKIIDFGAVRVSGLAEAESGDLPWPILGTAQYTAPEYFVGESGSPRSDQFSLGVIAYQLLSGRLPYGAQVARHRTKAGQRKLRYQSVLDDTREIPRWMDLALAKAVDLDPYRRYEEISEFVHDLRHPNNVLLGKGPPPLMERNPLLFWQMLCLLQLLIIVALAASRH